MDHLFIFGVVNFLQGYIYIYTVSQTAIKRMVYAECGIYPVRFGLNLIWGLSGFRSAVEGSVITLEGSWKTQWSDLFHAARQQSQAVCCWASLSILKTLFPAPTIFFSTNQLGLKSLSPSPSFSRFETLLLDLIPRGWIYPDWCTQQKGIIPDYMSAGRQC